ncbi:vWA domain-containing protein [Caldinitratiruptor microaerophilus]|uniref:VWA domain-containing protein n=1 Tax=Caldinitratiruptor microaerophilus TaxID=671077 RepID=A0AA35CKK8_9FIRM|nr:VWA domain-containing protein [Caldinitratiruptor microaerophilus]BDG60847.1 hypothetical protein caldi_19370 [Caldinitratiruptor microaerophilus]
MEWQAPGALFLGLTVPAILALYFLRRRRPRRRVPSLLLWRPASREEEANAPWQRLRPRLLLFLQLLAALALALAAARPVWSGAAGRSVHRIVLLDGSGSMRAAVPDPPGSRYGLALERVREVARAMAPGDRMSVIFVGARPRVLVSEATRAAQVEAVLAGAPEAGYGPADLRAALALAAGLTGEAGAAEWMLVSDGALDLPPAAALPRPGVAFRHVRVGGPAGNVAVTGLAARGRAVQVGLANLGDERVAGRVVLEGDGRPLASRQVELDPGAETHVTWEPIPPARVLAARLDGFPSEGNALAYDDAAWWVATGAGRARVLLVSPGSRFLEQALAAHGGVDAFRVSPEDYAGVAGGAYDLTIFDRWLPPAWPPGGVLVVGPPPGSPLLPVQGEFRPGQVNPRAGHPLLAHVDWRQVHVARAVSLPLEPSARGSGHAWEPVVDSDGGPLLAIQEAGSGRRAVLTFRLQDSDLGLRPAFPVLMANLVDWLAPRPDAIGGVLRPGEALPLPPLPLARAVSAVSPDGTRTELAPPWPPRPLVPDRPGLWRLAVQREPAAGGGQREYPVAVNGYDPRESRLTGQAVTLPGPGGVAAPAPAARRPLWPALAAVALGVALVEWWVDGRER